LIKVIKTFAAERKEILGVRIRFKGRVNRWRRTKFILGNRGTLPLQTISERIEQGTAQAVNKKGAVGIRIWLRYKQSFSFILKDHILKYMNYSKALRVRKITRSLVLK
jgi:ribosomal protein S3